MQILVDVPAGKSGTAEIDKFTINPLSVCSPGEVVNLMKASIDGRGIPVGTYTRLRVDGKLWMSDTPAEVRDHVPFIKKAHGNVLITGLGLGVVIKGLIKKRSVKSITVIEKSKDVFNLVAPTYSGPEYNKLLIIVGDAYKKETARSALAHVVEWDYAWHDIWPAFSDENLPQMAKLKKLYKAKVTMCWGEEDCQAMHNLLALARKHKRSNTRASILEFKQYPPAIRYRMKRMIAGIAFGR